MKLKSKFFIEKHCQCLSVNFYHFLQSQCWILDMLSCFVCLDLLSPCESIPTNALSCCFIAGSSGCTLAPLQTALPKCACWTRLFTVASIEPWRTATWSLHRVAESSVLTLALLLAVRSPVFIVTVWKVKGQTQYTESCKTLAFSNIFIYLLILFQTERVSSYIDLYRNHGIGLLRSYPSDLIWGTCNLFQPAAQLLLVIVWLNVTSAAMHALSSTGALVAALHVWLVGHSFSIALNCSQGGSNEINTGTCNMSSSSLCLCRCWCLALGNIKRSHLEWSEAKC